MALRTVTQRCIEVISNEENKRKCQNLGIETGRSAYFLVTFEFVDI
jgi:hypothetical protein